MYIHNFLSDLLLSLRILFDNIIFKPDFVRSYEFNVANRSFSLSKQGVDYRPNYEFPACLISLNSENPSFGERPTTIQRTPIPNFNMIPVVYDPESQNVVYIQEEQTQVLMSVIFNCESQFQAKETEFRIKRYLPVNKYIQLFKFTSFLEIPERDLLTHGIDFNNHEINNLYTRINKNTGNVDYCYAVRYQPLIRLDSSSVSISDTGQRSFPVNLEIMYQIQMPMWISYDKIPGDVTSIHVDFNRFGNEPISENSTRPLNKDKDDKFGGKKRLVKRNLLVHDLSDHEFAEFQDSDKISFSIQFRKEDFIILKDYQFDIFDVSGKFHRNIKPIMVDTNLNKVVFEFSKLDYESFYKATITKPIIVQFIELFEDGES